MDTAYISAFAALAGSLVGGLTSVIASWLSQYVQLRARQQTDDMNRREDLYRRFIDEASRLYADALEHNEARVSNLVELYSLISMMRVLSTPLIIANAERVVRAIVETYLAPNRTFRDVTEILDKEMDPLLDFSNACREELGMTPAPLQKLRLGPEQPVRRAPLSP